MTAAIGADYSTKAVHLSVVSDRAVLRREIVDMTGDMRHALEALRLVLRALAATAPTVYLEDPWIRPDQKGMKTALAVHRIARFVEAMAILAGLNVVYVPIPTWRSQLFGRQPGTEEAKRAAIAYVRQAFAIDTSPDHNAADSICLGAFGVAQMKIGARMLGGKPL